MKDNKHDRSTEIYAEQREKGKSHVFAKAFAWAFAWAIDLTNNHEFAEIYAEQREKGKSHKFAMRYAISIDQGKSRVFAWAYAWAICQGKSHTFALVFAEAYETRMLLGEGKYLSHVNAMAVAEQKEKEEQK